MQVPTTELEERMARFQEQCRARGVKLTPQRLEIFRAVAGSLAHPDAETVLLEVRARFPNLSFDTVYRTLWLFNELGLVKTLGPRRERVRFDAETRPHHHYFCKRCQKVWDLSVEWETPVNLPKEARDYGTVEAVHLELQGICQQCARETQSSLLAAGESKHQN
jgi:Fur family peroxide stress response transcriptional regulator